MNLYISTYSNQVSLSGYLFHYLYAPPQIYQAMVIFYPPLVKIKRDIWCAQSKYIYAFYLMTVWPLGINFCYVIQHQLVILDCTVESRDRSSSKKRNKMIKSYNGNILSFTHINKGKSFLNCYPAQL